MAIGDPVPNIEAFLVKAWSEFKAFVGSATTRLQDAVAKVKEAIGWAEANEPKIDAALAASAAMLSAYFPGAVEAAAFLSAVEAGVAFAEKVVKGADGVIATIENAVAPSTSATGAEKNATMNQFVDNAGYTAIPTPVVNHFAEAQVLAIHDPTPPAN